MSNDQEKLEEENYKFLSLKEKFEENLFNFFEKNYPEYSYNKNIFSLAQNEAIEKLHKIKEFSQDIEQIVYINNAIKHTCKHEIDKDIRKSLISILEDIGPTHLKSLNYFDNYLKVNTNTSMILNVETDEIIDFLISKNLVVTSGGYNPRSTNHIMITKIGYALLRFVGL